MIREGIPCIVLSATDLNADKNLILNTIERTIMSYPNLKLALLHYNGHGPADAQHRFTNGKWACENGFIGINEILKHINDGRSKLNQGSVDVEVCSDCCGSGGFLNYMKK